MTAPTFEGRPLPDRDEHVFDRGLQFDVGNLLTRRRVVGLLAAVALLATACAGESVPPAADATTPATTTTDAASPTNDTTVVGDATDAGTDDVSEAATRLLAAAWSDNVTVIVDGDVATVSSDGLPSHEVLEVYLADGQDGKYVAGGVVATPTSFEIPLSPSVADTPTDTSFGAIGIAVSGAVFFDPYEGDGSGIVANDDNTTIDSVPFIDACGGHPLPNETTYHYHGIPFCITDALDTPGQHSEVIGYLLDGFAIYGPQDVDGEEPNDLDSCMGHVGEVPGVDGEVYHYHVTSTANYISECFAGTASVTTGGPGAGRP